MRLSTSDFLASTTNTHHLLRLIQHDYDDVYDNDEEEEVQQQQQQQEPKENPQPKQQPKQQQPKENPQPKQQQPQMLKPQVSSWADLSAWIDDNDNMEKEKKEEFPVKKACSSWAPTAKKLSGLVVDFSGFRPSAMMASSASASSASPSSASASSASVLSIIEMMKKKKTPTSAWAALEEAIIMEEEGKPTPVVLSPPQKEKEEEEQQQPKVEKKKLWGLVVDLTAMTTGGTSQLRAKAEKEQLIATEETLLADVEAKLSALKRKPPSKLDQFLVDIYTVQVGLYRQSIAQHRAEFSSLPPSPPPTQFAASGTNNDSKKKKRKRDEEEEEVSAP